MKEIDVSQTAVALGVLVGVVMVLIQVMLGLLLDAREVDAHLMNSNCIEALRVRGVDVPEGFNFTFPRIITYPSEETAGEALVNDTDVPP